VLIFESLRDQLKGFVQIPTRIAHVSGNGRRLREPGRGANPFLASSWRCRFQLKALETDKTFDFKRDEQ